MKMRVLARVGTTVLASCGLFGQSSPQRPAFEVASVKPISPQDRIIGLFTWPGGRVTATMYTLKQLIQEAYGVQPFQISGGPGWTGEERYDIDAKPPASSESSKSSP